MFNENSWERAMEVVRCFAAPLLLTIPLAGHEGLPVLLAGGLLLCLGSLGRLTFTPAQAAGGFLRSPLCSSLCLLFGGALFLGGAWSLASSGVLGAAYVGVLCFSTLLAFFPVLDAKLAGAG